MNPLLDNEQSSIKAMHWPFFGCYMQQTPRAVMSFNRLLNSFSFDTIIELGTHDGGLSSLFALYCLGSRMGVGAETPNEPTFYKASSHHKSPKTFHTYDCTIRDVLRMEMLKQMGTVFERLDFLNVPASIERISAVIRNGRRVLLLCDGGNKLREFDLYAPSLKPGDIIMLHDWALNEAAFESIKARNVWHGCEVMWSDMRDRCARLAIRPAFNEEFDESMWFCGIKT